MTNSLGRMCWTVEMIHYQGFIEKFFLGGDFEDPNYKNNPMFQGRSPLKPETIESVLWSASANSSVFLLIAEYK